MVGVVDYDIQKGENMIIFFLEHGAYIWMLTTVIVEKCNGPLAVLSGINKKYHPHNDDKIEPWELGIALTRFFSW